MPDAGWRGEFDPLFHLVLAFRMKPVDFERTTPEPSRWDQDDAKYVRSTDEWIARCAARMTGRWADVTFEQAFAVAQQLSLQDTVRALSPEQVADDIE